MGLSILSSTDFPEVEDVLVVASKERGKTEVKARIFPNIDVIKKKLGHMPSLSDIKAMIGKIISDINAKMPKYKHISNLYILAVFRNYHVFASARYIQSSVAIHSA